MSPSAFIPFCEFGGNMSDTGFKYEQFNLHVCSCFETKMLNDQLCYEVNLDKFKSQRNLDNDLKLGFAFLMDYNEDRQVDLDDAGYDANTDGSYGSKIDGSNDDDNAFIYLNTIGNHFQFPYFMKNMCLFAEPVKLIGEGKYNLNQIREIKVTESYLGLDQDVKDCQNEEELETCTTMQHINTVIKECGCLPFSFIIPQKVVMFPWHTFQKICKLVLLSIQESHNISFSGSPVYTKSTQLCQKCNSGYLYVFP